MSSDPVELKKLVKQLQGATTNQDTIALLRLLKKDFKVNEAVLRESKAGLAVGKLRNHSSKDVADLAKELVKQWKSDVDQAKAAAGGGASSKSGSASGNASGNGKPGAINTAVRKNSVASNGPGTPRTPGGANGNSSARTMKSDGVTGPFVGERTRDKCIELVYDAIACDSGAPVDLLLAKSKAIEAAVFASFDNSSTGGYATKMRSLFVNLKDKSNPGLREAVASGEIPVEKFVTMSSQEMASDERKKADAAIAAQNLHNALGAAEPEAETTAFQCSKCKQRRCRYRQAQTRSADEPMTTFVTCVNCNNRWKFS